MVIWAVPLSSLKPEDAVADWTILKEMECKTLDGW
jgi:hypothetical protein